mmetsp:Transcript_40035/g.83363  ORF Transcript_40035/g.83363 Transcript_40035/m.83363 type:complete len:218 (-) Transcript_40035:2730-3383(-)
MKVLKDRVKAVLALRLLHTTQIQLVVCGLTIVVMAYCVFILILQERKKRALPSSQQALVHQVFSILKTLFSLVLAQGTSPEVMRTMISLIFHSTKIVQFQPQLHQPAPQLFHPRLLQHPRQPATPPYPLPHHQQQKARHRIPPIRRLTPQHCSRLRAPQQCCQQATVPLFRCAVKFVNLLWDGGDMHSWVLMATQINTTMMVCLPHTHLRKRTLSGY